MKIQDRRLIKHVRNLGAYSILLIMISMLAWPFIASADVRKNINYPGDSSDVYYFIHISDPHIGITCDFAEQNFSKLISQMNDAYFSPVCIINTGDLTDGSSSCLGDPTCETCIPDGPHQDEWLTYHDILNPYPNFIEKYYDLPGNHDRYGQTTHWGGETGNDGYKNYGIRGSSSNLSIKSGSLEGQYSWENNSDLFMAINTCDEVGISFADYEIINANGSDIVSPLLGSDLPVLSQNEINHVRDTLSNFRLINNSRLSFLFGHHSIKTEDDYIGEWLGRSSSLPGLYDIEGYVLNSICSQTESGATTLELFDASTFPDPEGQSTVTAWIDNGILPGWDNFTYTGKDSQNPNILTGCQGINGSWQPGTIVVAHRPDRGAGALIDAMDEYEVSAYLYGHTHTEIDSVHLVEHPDPSNDKKVVAMNTGALKNGFYRIVAVDNGGVSTTVAELDQWPVILITAPVDRYLSGGDLNPYYNPIPLQPIVVRALGFSDSPGLELEFSVQIIGHEREWLPMSPVQGVDHLYEGTWNDVSNFAETLYWIWVREKNQDSTKRLIEVDLVEVTEPTMKVSPDDLTFTAQENGSDPDDQNISITELSGTSSFNWQASESISWLSLSKTSGTSGESITVSVNSSGISDGTYTGIITFTATTAGVEGSPKVVNVKLIIGEEPPPPGTPTGDAYVGWPGDNINYGSLNYLYVGGKPITVGWDPTEAYIKFNVPVDNMTVTDATLKVRCTNVEDGGYILACDCADSWSEGSVTYDNRPTGYYTSKSTSVSSTGWKEWDVTSMVQKWVNGERTNYGFYLRAQDPSSTFVTFASRENSNYRPQLEITYFNDSENPNLIVSQPSPDNGLTSPPFYVGQTIDWYAITTNLGSGDAEDTRTGFWITDSPNVPGTNPFQDNGTGVLIAGDSDHPHESYAFTSSDVGTDKYIVVKADWEGTQHETNENDNVNYYGPFSVRPEPDFGISCIPGSREIDQGESTTYNITLTSLNDFHTPVSLTLGGCPAGASYSFQSDEVTPHGSSVLTINTETSITTGSYPLTITGTGDGKSHATSVELVVIPGEVPLPSPATNPDPSHLSTNVSISKDLSWSDGGGAASYNVYFGTNPTPGGSEFQGNQSATSYDPGFLEPDTNYYWCIDAVNSAGTTPGSIWRFRTGSAPEVVSEWVKLLGSTGIDEEGNGIAVDTNGNVYITGSTDGNPSSETKPGQYDIVVAKYDANGINIWTKLIGTWSYELGRDILVNSNGYLYITGYANGNLDGETNSGNYDAVIAKYDSSGTKQWTELFGSIEDDLGYGISVDGSGYIYVTGYTQGALSGETNTGGKDIYIVKYDSGSAREWTKLLGTSQLDQGWDITTDVGGNIYVTGFTEGTLGGEANAGANDIAVAKYNSSGTREWVKLLGSPSDDYGISIAVDGKGGVYIAGRTYGNLDGNTNAGESDAFIAKYNASGTREWTKLLGSSSNESCLAIASDGRGDVYITGVSYGDLGGQTNTGDGDIFVAKYDTNGTRKWLKLFGSSSQDVGRGITVDGSGHIYVTGSTKGNLNGETNEGGSDIFIWKLYDPTSRKKVSLPWLYLLLNN